jgi:TP901 family phage tail tape measure protein
MPPPAGGSSSKLVVDASKGISELDKLIASFLRLNTIYKKVIDVSGEINGANKLVTASFVAVTDAGNTVNISLDKVGKGFQATTSEIGKSVREMNAYAKAQALASANTVKGQLTSANPLSGKRGSDDEKAALQTAITNAAKLVANQKYSAAQINDINKRLTTDINAQYKVQEQEGVRAVKAIITAYANLGLSAKEAARAASAAIRGIAVGEKTKTLFPVDGKSTERELEPVRRAINVVVRSFQEGKVKVVDFNAAMKALNAGDFSNKNLTASQEKLRQQLFNIQQAALATGKTQAQANDIAVAAQKKLQDALDATTAKQQRYRDAVAAQAAIQAKFATPLSSSSTADIEKFNTKLNSLLQDVQRGKLTLFDLNQAILAIGKNKNPFTNIVLPPSIEAARVKLDALGASFDRSATAAATALKKQQDELAKTTLSAQRYKDAVAAQAAVQAQFSTQLAGASASQINSFNQQMNVLIQRIVNGKLSVLGFTQALAEMGRQPNPFPKYPPNPEVEKATTQLNKLKTAFDDTGKSGKEAGVSISSSLNSLGTITGVVYLLRQIEQLKNSFKDTVEEAAKFSRSIALIQTLSQESGVSFDQWASSVIRVSDSLGLESADVAKGAYDALSNQVIETSADFDRFGLSVGRLAQVTGSSFKNSIDAVSGVMNSFGKDISDTEKISGILFKGIDLGKITMNELSSSIGRVGPLAKSLGVTVEELTAFMSVLTRQGISVDVAMTEVGQVFNKLAKPSAELADFFKKIGVTSGEEAIAVYSLAGVFKKLQEETGGSAAAISKLFDELRGAKGILGVLANEGKDFASDLEQIKDAQGTFEGAKKIFDINPGQKFLQQMQEIKNFFLVTWETSILKNILKATDYFGGLAQTIKTVYNIAVQVGGPIIAFGGIVKGAVAIEGIIAAAQAFLGIGAAASAATPAIASAGAATAFAFGPVTIVLAAVAAAFAFIKIQAIQADAAMSAFAEKARDDAAKDTAESSRLYSLQVAKQTDTLKEGIDAAKQQYEQLVVAARAASTEILDSQKEASKAAGESVRNSMDLFTHALRDEITALNSDQTKLQSAIAKGQKEIAANNEKLEKFNYSRAEAQIATGYNPNVAGGHFYKGNEQNVELEYLAKKHIAELKSEASLAAQAGDLDTVKKKYQDIEKILENLSTKTVTKHNVRDDRDYQAPAFLGIQHAINDVQKEYAAVNQQIIKQEQQKAELARQQEQQKRADLGKLEDIFKKIASFSAFDKQGNIKKAYIDDPEKATADLEALQQEALKLIGTTESFSGKLAILKDFKGALADLRKGFDAQRSTQATTNEAQLVTQGFTANLAEYEKAILRLNKGIDETKKNLVSLRAQLDASKDSAKADVKTILEGLTNNAGSGFLARTFGSGGSSANDTQVAKVRAEFQGLQAQLENLNPKNIEAAQTSLAKVRELLEGIDRQRGLFGGASIFSSVFDPAKGTSLEDFLRTVSEQLVKTQELKAKEEEQNEVVKAQQKLVEEYQGKIDLMKTAWNNATSAIAVFGADSTKVLGQLKEQLTLANAQVNDFKSGLAGAGAGLAPAPAARGAFSQAQIDQLNAGASINDVIATPKATGGKVGYFAGGGSILDFMQGKMSRGSDTVPIMATPGEFVMTKEATASFLPQLIAMNKNPAYRSAGGSTTTVGDITVNVSGSQSSKETARQIGFELRREIQRGTLRLT